MEKKASKEKKKKDPNTFFLSTNLQYCSYFITSKEIFKNPNNHGAPSPPATKGGALPPTPQGGPPPIKIENFASIPTFKPPMQKISTVKLCLKLAPEINSPRPNSVVNSLTRTDLPREQKKSTRFCLKMLINLSIN